MSREAMQMALEWVEAHADQWDGHGASPAVICAAIRAALAEQAQPVAWDDQPECSDDDVICPVCCSTFRAIPVAVQRLMLDAGFEPPFTTPPAPQSLRDLCAAAYQVVGVADGPVEMLDNLWAAAEGKPLPHDPGAGLPWSPPSPQPLSGLDVERLLEDVVGSLPVARKLIRAVEAEVIRRIGVQR